MRLIDADALHKEIVSQYGPQATPDGIMRSGVLNALHLIETAPTVDAEPVRHGKWIDDNAGNHDPRDRWVKCSLCGYKTTSRFITEYKGCPNCRAKMTGGKRE